MMSSLKDLALWAFHLSRDVGKAAVVLIVILCGFLAIAYPYFEGTSLTVINRSGQHLSGVKLLTGIPETGVDEIWETDLSPGETEWAYALTRKDRAVLRYVVGGKAYEVECPYESGTAISVEMTVTPDGSLACDSWMRI